uniref:Uncharacterized protein n=1 Tax=Anguilla anguilla TaxID=7936 RepID=A0A0E9XQ54_ANGAN
MSNGELGNCKTVVAQLQKMSIDKVCFCLVLTEIANLSKKQVFCTKNTTIQPMP